MKLPSGISLIANQENHELTPIMYVTQTTKMLTTLSECVMRLFCKHIQGYFVWNKNKLSLNF